MDLLTNFYLVCLWATPWKIIFPNLVDTCCKNEHTGESRIVHWFLASAPNGVWLHLCLVVGWWLQAVEGAPKGSNLNMSLLKTRRTCWYLDACGGTRKMVTSKNDWNLQHFEYVNICHAGNLPTMQSSTTTSRWSMQKIVVGLVCNLSSLSSLAYWL